MRTVSYLLIAAALSVGSAAGSAQERFVAVAAPGALARLIAEVAPAFTAQTGIAVEVTPEAAADALVVPERLALPSAQSLPVLFADAVLVGSRADRARVRGLPDMAAAFRWIASARALYVSSSSELGLREFELQLWEGVVTLSASKRTYSPIWSPDRLKQQCWP